MPDRETLTATLDVRPRSSRVLGLVFVLLVAVALTGCAAPESLQRSTSEEQTARPDPNAYPASVRRNFLRACDAAADAAAKAASKKGGGRFADSKLYKWGTAPACTCEWEWITTNVPYRDFVEWELEVRSGGDNPDWVVDALMACTT